MRDRVPPLEVLGRFQAAEFDAKGQRIQKAVTDSGDLGATTAYLYNRQQKDESCDPWLNGKP